MPTRRRRRPDRLVVGEALDNDLLALLRRLMARFPPNLELSPARVGEVDGGFRDTRMSARGRLRLFGRRRAKDCSQSWAVVQRAGVSDST